MGKNEFIEKTMVMADVTMFLGAGHMPGTVPPHLVFGTSFRVRHLPPPPREHYRVHSIHVDTEVYRGQWNGSK